MWPNFRFDSLPGLLCLLWNGGFWKVTREFCLDSAGTFQRLATAGVFSRCLPCYGLKRKVKLIYSGSRSEIIIIFEIITFQRLSVIHSHSDQILSTFSKPEIRELYASSSGMVIIPSILNKIFLFLLTATF